MNSNGCLYDEIENIFLTFSKISQFFHIEIFLLLDGEWKHFKESKFFSRLIYFGVDIFESNLYHFYCLEKVGQTLLFNKHHIKIKDLIKLCWPMEGVNQGISWEWVTVQVKKKISANIYDVIFPNDQIEKVKLNGYKPELWILDS